MTTHVDCTVTHSGIGNSFQHVDFELVNDHEDKEAAEMTNMCPRLRHCIQHCIQPVLVESHPLTADAPWYQRFLNNFFCPPHSRMGGIIFMIVLTSCIWVTLFSVTGEEALPGGNLFALLALFVLCWSGGYIARLTRLPSLLDNNGMNAWLPNSGVLSLNHVEDWDYYEIGGFLGRQSQLLDLRVRTLRQSSTRQIALTVILTRAGLGLDPKALRRLSFVVLRLAFLPCLTETIIDGIASHLILGFPWQWAFMLGFVIAAVSPAVVVPSLISLGERRYGIDKGIPTLVIAAASLDDILAITGFGVLLGITFSTGDIAWTLSKGPLEVVLGTVYGIIGGIILWYIPQKSSRHLLFFRTLLLMTLGLMAIFTSIKFHWAGAGPLAVLTVSFIAAVRWRSEFPENEKNPVENVIGVVWMIFQPFLFGLIGSEVDVFKLDLDVIVSEVKTHGRTDRQATQN
ncbi:sodium/hydrogen exchanger 9B2-like isoform X3 [Biomphalaria glabrata]|uniref:Sodium/hydrogen exchanger 9B2-like isoform X3 n=1 Tax=Biomphalaria glabrata TaxID=6526 RepID=A0A9W2ZL87_BIOGL|nr:sodium/hydrogen exchanger 9B2-like isoform X3 [Biomphalaria glabrata]